VRKLRIAIAVAIVALIAAGAGVASAKKSGDGAVTLTLWHNYGNDNDAIALNHLIAGFEKLHPTIQIKAISQPGSNYFALLQASQISHTGPDISVQWTGLYDLKYAKYLVNLRPYLSASDVARITGAPYMAPDFDLSKGLLVMPESNDFYIGFYNKALFKKAGIAAPPADWADLTADCSKLKAIGVTPMEYGLTSGLVLGSSFYPWFDASYLLIGAYSPQQWRGLYNGQVPWTSPAIQAQVQKWADLRSSGCTNSDVLTGSGILSKLAKGKAAMIVDGTWDTGTLQQQMGKNLGAFVPPYSNSKIHSVVDYPGQGYAVMKDSKHQAEAIQFIKFMLTKQAATIVGNAGLVPDIRGYSTTNSITNQLLDLVAKQHYRIYPMLDSVVQPEIVTAGQKELVAAFAGNISVSSALKNLQDTLNSLPASLRGSVFTGG
jgi:ABC-type glycerol-3-phosphate transport system substrate-binding protein